MRPLDVAATGDVAAILKPYVESSTGLVATWVYLMYAFKPAMLSLSTLTSYSTKGDHGLEYKERYFRDTHGSEYWSDVKQ